MRLNIADIIKARPSATESEAINIENVIDQNLYMDWSECTLTELKKSVEWAVLFIIGERA